ncbi:hypothetical protein A6M27_16935 [Acidithiobacillus thiooxidans]|uniref:hypothetical protein n=2 Tax=Acidithiobacillus thiooxidans TaxID=930 RepID=UPI000466B1C1|nr:hypothetical protein [Acidithiobacillus thiooxidans]OCX70485.1 hypothetical protein A6O24_16450 [Acidithiobacillus thiooxidans]OCX81059.1 hypothetical protein A6O26_13785 [Acidithiobacillus thiooxidans]OCX83779.1 hypothetical protein A6M27_16935 [Acidithiobacillus thiooxidans]OFC50265.1 hypothetical protein BAE47_02920 [Acidithiobacillus thiooxidans]
MSGLSLKNWGPLADLLMIAGFLALVTASADSTAVSSEASGPFALIAGALHPYFHSSILGDVYTGMATVGLIYWVSHQTGRNGGIYFLSDAGNRIKEAQPFSRARGYGVWQGFYYAAFWCLIIALSYNILFAVYALSPGSFPFDSISAWIYAWGHWPALVKEIYSVGGMTYIPAVATWIFRAFPKNVLFSLGLLRIRHWYSETADEAELSEAVGKMAEEQSHIMTMGWIFGSR